MIAILEDIKREKMVFKVYQIRMTKNSPSISKLNSREIHCLKIAHSSKTI
jgi:hypothetical protein